MTSLAPLSLLTTEDERRHLSVQVCGIVQRLQLTDVEQQLRLLVSVRAAFPQLQPVLVALVHAALRLLLRRLPPTSKWYVLVHCFLNKTIFFNFLVVFSEIVFVCIAL